MNHAVKTLAAVLLAAVAAPAAADEPPPPVPSVPPPAVDVHIHDTYIKPAAPAAEPRPATKPVAPTAAPDKNAPLPWLDKLSDGIDAARRDGKPIVVDVGAEWCGWCKLLDKEVVKPEVQAKLAGWTRVRLDADRDGDAVRTLSVGPIPALRLLTPSGRVVASQDGFLTGKDLTAWLDDHFKQAATAPAEVLGGAAGEAPADPAAVDALMPKLSDADPVVREAVTRRLLRRPDLAAAKVVSAFADGKLATRLSALELLQEWKAPIEKLDPWDPPTITPDRIAALKKWAAEAEKHPVASADAANPATHPTTGPSGSAVAGSALTPDRLADARRDIAAMLQSTTEPEVLAARERLARYGPALLSEVYAALKAANTDRDRERLTALRYRLVASDALALGWAGGLERLASSDPAVRHAAVDELGSKVTPADTALLSELFADPDPLVREQSLRLLQAVGGDSAGGATAGLARLLRDPEPNVRAAVLKQLAETPMPGMDKEVVKFVATEKDPDLLVHAVRVLREAKTTAAVDCLMSLLGHESWRVRAEAAEALGKAVQDRASDEKSTARLADVYAAMIRLLDDPDGYVVGRAVLVLRDARVNAALEPMVKAAEKRPELAGEVVRALARDTTDPAATRFLRKFCAHPDAGVRAAAVAALCEAQPDNARDEIAAALKDPAANVRLAGAEGLERAMVKSRPDPDQEVGGLLSFGKKHKPDLEAWLGNFREGQSRPRWMTATEAPLLKMLSSGSNDEKLAAAVPLLAFGHDDQALPVLRQAVKGPIADRQWAVEALPWLPWDERLEMYKELTASAGHAELPRIAEAMIAIPDPKAAGLLWDLLANPAADATVAAFVETSLRQLYLGNRYYSVGSADQNAALYKPLLDAANDKAAHGTEMQRLAALALLLGAASDQAAGAAEKVLADAALPQALRGDALQVLLLARPRPEAEKLAVAVVKGERGPDPRMKKAAVRFLALGPSGVRQLRDSIYLNRSGSDDEVLVSSRSGNERTVTIKPPEGLTAEALKPMLADPDREQAACAAYLLCLLGDRSAIDPLVAYWREKEKRSDEWRKLVYRAVAVLNDDSLVPVLEEVYKNMSANGEARWNAGDFYWTIRSMKGPNVLKLRKKIRDEVGMENLH